MRVQHIRTAEERKARREALLPRVMELHATGCSWYEIERRVGIGRTSLRCWLDPVYNKLRLERERRARRERRKDASYTIAPRVFRRPSVPFVRCLDGVVSSKWQMVRP